MRLIEQAKPAAVMLENVPGFASEKFAAYRSSLIQRLYHLGYEVAWRVLNSSDYGVPQLRPRFILVALRLPYFDNFSWPLPIETTATVGHVLHDLMASRGWPGANRWRLKANGIAPTLVGGSKNMVAPILVPRAPEGSGKLWVLMVKVSRTRPLAKISL